MWSEFDWDKGTAICIANIGAAALMTSIALICAVTKSDAPSEGEMKIINITDAQRTLELQKALIEKNYNNPCNSDIHTTKLYVYKDKEWKEVKE